jgi:urease accessory protein
MMKTLFHLRQHLTVAFASLPLLALAHAGDADHHAHPFSSGFAHPFSGWDHYLSFMLIGLLAWRVRRSATAEGAVTSRALAAASVVSLFIVAMLGGFVAAQRFMGLPYAEFAIAGLIIALGFVLVLMTQPSFKLCALIAVLIGYVHGYVHGIELAGAWQAAWGMLSASALLTVCGIALSATLQRVPNVNHRVLQIIVGIIGAIAVMLGVSLLAQ